MATKLAPRQVINVVVVPDCEKENIPPFVVPKLALGAARQPRPPRPERVFRDITRLMHREDEPASPSGNASPQPTAPVFCRV